MSVYMSFLLLAFACSVLSEGGQLFEPCNKDDIKCLRTAAQTFLEKTYKGLPDSDMKPLDPLIIPELEVVVDEGLGLVFKFLNLNITGLKNQQVSDFQMDSDKRSVILKTKSDLNIVGDLTIGLFKKGKVFSGTYSATTTALGSSQYGYSFVKKGDQDYFVIGPETNTCEIIGEPNVSIDSDLLNTLNKDSDAKDIKPIYENNKDTLRKITLCKIVETAYITVIHNLRSAAKNFPKSAFFKDI